MQKFTLGAGASAVIAHQLNIGRLLQAAETVAQRLHRSGPAIAQLEQTAQIEIDLAAAGQSAKEALAGAPALIPVEIDHQFLKALAFFSSEMLLPFFSRVIFSSRIGLARTELPAAEQRV
jgi:hypothetical protein